MSVDRGMVARTALGALLIAIPAALIAILVSLLRTPAYEASAQVWVKHVGLLQQTYPTGSAEQIQAPPPIGGLQALMPTMIQVRGQSLRGRRDRPTPGLTNGLRRTVGQPNHRAGREHESHMPHLRRHQSGESPTVVGTLAEVSSERISETKVAKGNDIKATVYREVSAPKTLADPKPLRSGPLTLVVV